MLFAAAGDVTIMKLYISRFLSVFLLTLLFFNHAFAQTTIVKGTVRDAVTQLPLQDATVAFPAGRGSITDARGNYLLQTQKNYNHIIVTFVGYKNDTIKITPGIPQQINILLKIDTTAKLGNVVVKKNKHKGYSNKNNPAVDLIREVLAHKESNQPLAYDYAQYEQYDKLEFSLSNPSNFIVNNKLVGKYKFVTQNRDTTKIPGRSLLPIYLEETISEKYFRKTPKAVATKVIAKRKVNFGEYVDDKGISGYFNFVYTDIDIYQPNIVFLTSQLQSPISALAPSFYYFTIQDTVVDEHGEKFVQLYFTPRNNGDVLFRGIMLITTDGTYAVKKVDMNISKKININYVRSIMVKQEFEKNSAGRMYLSKSLLGTEFGISVKPNAEGIYGERNVSYKNFVINQPQNDSIYALKDKTDEREDHPEKSDTFWAANRHDTLSYAESKVYGNMDSLIHMRSYKTLMDWSTVFIAGYKTFPGFEVGPLASFYSFNPIEGFRLRAGARTTTKFNTRWYLSGYGAYGFKDQKWKYFGAVAYSFNNKSIYDYPNDYLRVSYQYDLKIPGQELQFTSDDNFLLSFKRGENDKYIYNRIGRIEYVKEYANHFGFKLGTKYWAQTPTGALSFVTYENGTPQTVETLTTGELSLELRYAPHESFYQTRAYRSPNYNKYPMFTLRYIQGIKGLYDGQYSYSNIQFNIFKKFYLGQFGYTMAVFDAGYVVGQVPYPLLIIHRANQTYAYQLYSYNLMNFMEFVSDHFASINLDHNFSGLLFNRIPFLRKFKLREEATFKILEGGIRSENDPSLHPELYARPVDEHGVPITYALNSKPYMEASIGVANIFKLLRVDLVKRLTYLENPNVSSLGVRAMLKVDF